MMKRYLVLATALVLALPVISEAQHLDRYVTGKHQFENLAGTSEFRALPEPGQVVIELEAPPLLTRDPKVRRLASAGLDDLLGRLERDLATIEGEFSGARIRSRDLAGMPMIRHRYMMAFSGASARVDPRAIERIRQLDYVKHVHPDWISTAFLDESVAEVGAPEVWRDYGMRGEGVVVAIIDSGIDYAHPSLGGGIGAGFKVRGGRDFANNDSDPMDDHGHGTHVAGIVAANGGGLLGVAPDAELLAYKVLDGSGSGRDSWVLAGIEAAVKDGADIVNMSLGRRAVPDDPVVRAVENASAAGILFCVAAGNSGRFLDIGSPGNAPSALTVGAMDRTGRLAIFSSKGPVLSSGAMKPEIIAPGVNIVSAMPGGGSRAASGTSMAAPHVAGVAALLRSIRPDWTVRTLRSAIISSARSANNDDVMAVGAGRIFAPDAVEAFLFLSPNLLSFGVSDSSQESWSTRRDVFLVNRTDETQFLTLEIDGVGEGIDLRSSVSTLEMAPDETKRVDLNLAVDHSMFPAPESGSLSFGGLLRFTGEGSSISIPWSFIRASRVGVAWTGPGNATIRLGTARMMVEGQTQSGNSAVQLFIGAGDASLWLSTGIDGAAVTRHVFVENLDLSKGADITIAPEDAPHRVMFEGMDAFGVPLSSREASLREVVFRHPHFESRLIDSIVHLFSHQEMFLSDLSENVELLVFERAFDVDVHPRVTWAAQYPPVIGVDRDVELSLEQTAWSPLEIRGRIPSDLEKPYQAVSASVWLSAGSQTVVGVARPRDEPSDQIDARSEAWLTTTTSGNSGTSILIDIGETGQGDPHLLSQSIDFSAEFSAVEGGNVPGRGSRPTLSDRRIPTGQPIVIGEGPVYPALFVASFEEQMLGQVRWFGPHQEQRAYDAKRMTAEIRDEHGVLVASGQVPPRHSPGFASPFLVATELPIAGVYSFQAVNSSFDVAGSQAEATLTATIDSTREDAAAPTITYLRFRDAMGRTSSVHPKGSASMLEFSALDFSPLAFGELRREKTAVQFRAHRHKEQPNGAWVSATAVEVGDDLDSPDRLMQPEGILYRVDLSEATSTVTGAVDLRISIEDPSGNSTVYLLEPAFVVRSDRRPTVDRH